MSKSIALVNGVGVSFSCIRMLTGAFSVLYLLNKGVTVNEIGWLKAFQGFVLVFIDIPLSHVADRYSRKFSICLSILTAVLWLFITGISQTFQGFLLAEFFNALSLGLMSGTFSAYLYDTSKNCNQNKLAIEIFANYEKYSFFFMSLVSIIGAIIYSSKIGNIWIIASILMSTVFFLSLYLPSDKEHTARQKENLIDALKKIYYFFFIETKNGHTLLYINLIMAVLGQVLIQYWQILIPRKYTIDHMLSISIIFFFILNIQALSGVILEKFKDPLILEKIIKVSLILSFILICLGYFSTLFIVLSVILLFFNLSILSSIYIAHMIEIFPKENRSTLLSCLAVLSKIMVFIFMPICAYAIGFSSFVFISVISILLVFIYRWNNLTSSKMN